MAQLPRGLAAKLEIRRLRALHRQLWAQRCWSLGLPLEQWLPEAVDDLIDAYAAGTLLPEEIEAEVRAIVGLGEWPEGFESVEDELVPDEDEAA